MLNVLLPLLLLYPPATTFIYDDQIADQTIRRASHATYSLDLAEARKAARSLQSRYSDHPAGYLMEAETYWWEAQIDPTRKDIEDEFFKLQEKTIDIGEKALNAKKY